jgi:hypothetical protein
MSEIPIDKQVKHLVFLIKTMRIAVMSIWACFLTAICIILVVDLSERVYGKEQLQNTAAFDVIGFLLAGSALMTTMGAGLSTRLVIEAVTEHKRLIADDKRDVIEGL